MWIGSWGIARSCGGALARVPQSRVRRAAAAVAQKNLVKDVRCVTRPVQVCCVAVGAQVQINAKRSTSYMSFPTAVPFLDQMASGSGLWLDRTGFVDGFRDAIHRRRGLCSLHHAGWCAFFGVTAASHSSANTAAHRSTPQRWPTWSPSTKEKRPPSCVKGATYCGVEATSTKPWSASVKV